MNPGDIVQSVLAPATAEASSINHLWWVLLWVAAVTFSAVIAFLTAALIRGLRASSIAAHPSSERALSRSVAAAVAVTVGILLALLVASVLTSRSISGLQASSGVSIAVTGHQWWWEIEYQDAIPSRRVVTANEVHFPVNRPTVLKVSSRDVIHSFWAPNLQGKRDLIPGYTTAIWVRPDRLGRFRGQCAEFCGLQHAHMAFDVVVESEADFERWLGGMRQPAREPESELHRRGRDVFMAARCAGCHTILGTEAHGQTAPDLTHFASRATLGAGTLPNTSEHLIAWVRDSQASKPGNQMPPNPMSDDQLNALITYLGTLR